MKEGSGREENHVCETHMVLRGHKFFDNISDSLQTLLLGLVAMRHTQSNIDEWSASYFFHLSHFFLPF